MPFLQTKVDGKLALVCQDISPSSLEAEHLEELNKMLSRIGEHKIHADRAAAKVDEITKAIEGGLAISEGLKQSRNVEQQLEESRNKIKKGAFTVFAVDENGNLHEYWDPSTQVCDIWIHAEDLPVSEEKASFKVEIDRTLMVINQVLNPNGDRMQRARDVKRKRTSYLTRLVNICYVGLKHEDPSQLKLAIKSLDSFREEFVANEAGTAKNKYLRRLGLPCLVMSAVASLAYVYVVGWVPDPQNTPYRFRNFFMLIAGAGVGTWLSFALRRVILSFLDLAALEEDRLDPYVRVLFITALVHYWDTDIRHLGRSMNLPG